MKTEISPSVHQFPTILFESRTPVQGRFRINEGTARRFVQVADLRLGVIIGKRQPSVTHYEDEYDALIKKDFYVSIKNNMWRIGIDCERIQQRTIQQRDKTGSLAFEREYKNAVCNGLAMCLIREKLLNAGKYNRRLCLAYNLFLNNFFAPLALYYLANSLSDHENLKIGLATAAIVLFSNTVANLAMGTDAEHIRSVRQSQGEQTEDIFNEPFIRRRPSELILPPVPVDKLFAGIAFLLQHRKDFILTSNSNGP